MPAKNLFTKDRLVEAAFKIVRTRGWETLSARSLAEELNCSTMPIYSYLRSMKSLQTELKKKAIHLLLTYQTTKRTGQIFFDIGIGYVLFARHEKNLFRFLFEKRIKIGKHHNTGKMIKEFAFKDLTQKMKSDPVFEGLSEGKLKNILTKMWIFVHGLAFLINNNAFGRDKEDYIRELLKETGQSIIQGEKNKEEIGKDLIPKEGSY